MSWRSKTCFCLSLVRHSPSSSVPIRIFASLTALATSLDMDTVFGLLSLLLITLILLNSPLFDWPGPPRFEARRHGGHRLPRPFGACVWAFFPEGRALRASNRLLMLSLNFA